MEENRARRRSIRSGAEQDTGSLGARLAICAALCALTVLVRSAFPQAAEALSRWLLGDGSYKAAFSQLAESDSPRVEAFKALVLGGGNEN